MPAARVVFGGSAVIYGFLALLYLIAPPTQPHQPIAAIFILAGTFFAFVAVVIRRVEDRGIEPLLLLSVVVAEAGALAFLPLTGDPQQSVVVLIVILAAGAVAPTVRSAIAAALIGVLGWLYLARDFARPELIHWGINVFGAALVSVAVSVARLRAVAELRLTRFMIDRATDAVYLVTPEASLYYVNEAACRMLGYDRDELLALSVHDIDPTITPESWRVLQENLQKRRAFVLQSSHRTKDGRDLPVEISLSRAAFGGRRYDCAIARDVSERRLAEEQIDRARRVAEAASHAKSNFLATMSHEIRTPLNGVFGMTELALDTDDPAERREFVLRARASAATLLALLNDILDYSRMEVGQLSLEEVEFDPRALLRDLTDSLRYEAAGRRLELGAECDPRLPPRLRGDPRRLRQILLNLTVNALKFTELGEVRVRLEVEAIEAGHVRIAALVRDTGIGIAPDKLGSIFDAFTQVDGSDSRRYGGAGLGLAIARQLAETMGGTIDVTSTPGSGSTFRVRLRLPIAADAVCDATAS